MTFGTLTLLATMAGSTLTSIATPLAPAAVVTSAAQDPVKPKAAAREPRERPQERAEPPARQEPKPEARRDPPRAAPAERGTEKNAERPKSTGEPELRRRKP